MIKSKKGQIAPYQLFFILFVSRVVVTLTYVQTVSVGKVSTDLAISIFFSYIITMLASIPAYFCSLKNKNPLMVKWISFFYAVYFIYFASANVSRFSYFATSRLTPEASVGFFVTAILICACYASIMGIEGLGRFGSFCGVILLITVFIVAVFNLKNICAVNLFPIIENTKSDIIKNSIVLASNSIEPAVFLSIEDKVNGEKKRPLFLGITASYAVIFLLIVLCQLVMGSASKLQAYPIFTLFQLASIGSMSRLDIFHTAFWVLALFLKTSVLVLCASLWIKKYKHSTKCIIVTVLCAIAAFFITFVMGTNMVNITKIISVVLFAVFVVIIPIICNVFIKKSKVDRVVEEIRDN